MLPRLKHPVWLIAAQLAACWPVWRWYVARMTDGSDEPVGILALATALLMIWKEWRFSIRARSTQTINLLTSAFLLFLYAVTFPISPPLIRAVLVVTALSLTLSSLILGVRFHLALTGLLFLSLPIVSSLQFYLGYPLRMLCGYITLPFLGLAGFPSTMEGTSLRYGELLVSMDAPCSGIRMLWTGLFLAFALACFYRLRTREAAALCGISIGLIILANSLRAVSLFLLEVLPLPQMDRMHDMNGLVIFTLMGLIMVGVTRYLSREQLCVKQSSS